MDMLFTIRSLAQIVNENPTKNVFSLPKAPVFLDSITDPQFIELNRALRESNMNLIELEDSYLLVVLEPLMRQAEPAKSTELGHTHVDEFVDYNFGKHCYARFFFALHRLPSGLQIDFGRWMNKYRLFCKYKDKWFRVTGASRFGDIWLHSDFEKDCGYEHRVMVDECSEWSDSVPGTDNTKEQAMREALDLYCRLMTGQLSELSTMFRYGRFGFTDRIDTSKLDELDSLLLEIKRIMFPGLGPDSSYSILDAKNVSKKAQLVYQEIAE